MWKNYGGRGIFLCKKWMEFENFFADMGDSFKEGLTLDRIDNNKGYSRDNCRWVTMRENQENRRNNVFITYGDKSMTITRWAEKFGFKRSTLQMRWYKYHWSIKECLLTPINSHRKRGE